MCIALHDEGHGVPLLPSTTLIDKAMIFIWDDRADITTLGQSNIDVGNHHVLIYVYIYIHKLIIYVLNP
jgi:hypothetical protein